MPKPWNVLRLALLGGLLGLLWGLYDGFFPAWALGGDHRARALGGLMGAFVGGAFVAGVAALMRNFLARAR